MLKSFTKMSEDKVYKDGDIVWVKLGNNWWPGEVTGAHRQPEGLIKHLKRRPYCVVKFFQEDAYEYVKSAKQIFPFQCSKKDEFIRKGNALYKAKNKFMEKFPADVEIAERLTRRTVENDILIINNRPDSIVKAILGQSLASHHSNDYYDSAYANNISGTNKRRSGDSVTKILNITQQSTTATASSKATTDSHSTAASTSARLFSFNSSNANFYRCNLCDFTSQRQNVMILHRRTHSAGASKPTTATPSPTKATPARSLPTTGSTGKVKPMATTTTVHHSTAARELHKAWASTPGCRVLSSNHESARWLPNESAADVAAVEKHEKIKSKGRAHSRRTLRSSPHIDADVSEITLPDALPTATAYTDPLDDSTSDVSSSKTEITVVSALARMHKPQNNPNPRHIIQMPRIHTKRKSEEIRQRLLADWSDEEKDKEDDNANIGSNVNVASNVAAVAPNVNVVGHVNNDDDDDDDDDETKPVAINEKANIPVLSVDEDVDVKKELLTLMPITTETISNATPATPSNRIRNIPKKDRRDVVLKEFSSDFTLSDSTFSTPRASRTSPMLHNDSTNSNSSSDSVVVLGFIPGNMPSAIINIDEESPTKETALNVETEAAVGVTIEAEKENIIAAVTAEKVQEDIVEQLHAPPVEETRTLEVEQIEVPEVEHMEIETVGKIGEEATAKEAESIDEQQDQCIEVIPPSSPVNTTAVTDNETAATTKESNELVENPLLVEETVQMAAAVEPEKELTVEKEPAVERELERVASAAPPLATSLSCFDFQEEEEDENEKDVLASIANFKKKYASPDKTANIESEQTHAMGRRRSTVGKRGKSPQRLAELAELEQQDQRLTAEIESLLKQTNTTVVDMSVIAAPTTAVCKEELPVKGLPIKERGKRIFKSRNRSRLEEQPPTQAETVKSVVDNAKEYEPNGNVAEVTAHAEVSNGVITALNKRDADVPESRKKTKATNGSSALKVDKYEQQVQKLAEKGGEVKAQPMGEQFEVRKQSIEKQTLTVEEEIHPTTEWQSVGGQRQPTAAEVPSQPIDDQLPLSKEQLQANEMQPRCSEEQMQLIEEQAIIPEAQLQPNQEHNEMGIHIADNEVKQAQANEESPNIQEHVAQLQSGEEINADDKEGGIIKDMESVEVQSEETKAINNEISSDVASERAVMETSVASEQVDNEQNHETALEALNNAAVAGIEALNNATAAGIAGSTLPLTVVTDDSLSGMKENVDQQAGSESLSRFTSPTDENSSVGISDAGAEFGSPASMLDDERLTLLTNSLATPTEGLTENIDSQVETGEITEQETVEETENVDRYEEEKSKKEVPAEPTEVIDRVNAGDVAYEHELEEDEDEIESPPHEALSGNELEAEMEKAKKSKSAKARQSGGRRKGKGAAANNAKEPKASKRKLSVSVEQETCKEVESAANVTIAKAVPQPVIELEAPIGRRVTRSSLQNRPQFVTITQEPVKELEQPKELSTPKKTEAARKTQTRRSRTTRRTISTPEREIVKEMPEVEQVVTPLQESSCGVIENATELEKSPIGKRTKHKEIAKTAAPIEKIGNTEEAIVTVEKHETLDVPTAEKKLEDVPAAECEPIATEQQSETTEKTTRKRRSHVKVTPRRCSVNNVSASDTDKIEVDEHDQHEPKTLKLETPIAATQGETNKTTKATKPTTKNSNATKPKVPEKQEVFEPKAMVSETKTEIQNYKLSKLETQALSASDDPLNIEESIVAKVESTPEVEIKLSEEAIKADLPSRLTNDDVHVEVAGITTESNIETTSATVPEQTESQPITATGTSTISEIRLFRPKGKTLAAECNTLEVKTPAKSPSRGKRKKSETDVGLNANGSNKQSVAPSETPTPDRRRTSSPIEKVRINVDVANPLSSQIANILATTGNNAQHSALAETASKINASATLKRKKSLEGDIPSFIIERPAQAPTAAQIESEVQRQAQQDALAHVQSLCPQVKITRKEKIIEAESPAGIGRQLEQQHPHPQPQHQQQQQQQTLQQTCKLSGTEAAPMFDIDNMPILLNNDQMLAQNVHFMITATAESDAAAIVSGTESTNNVLPDGPRILQQEILQTAHSSPPPAAVHQSKMQLPQQRQRKRSVNQQPPALPKVSSPNKQIGVDARGNKYVIIKTPPADLNVQPTLSFQQLQKQQPQHQHQQLQQPHQDRTENLAGTFNIGPGVTLRRISEPVLGSTSPVSPTQQLQQQPPLGKPKSPAAAATGGRKQAGNTITLPSSIATKQQKINEELSAPTSTTGTHEFDALQLAATGGAGNRTTNNRTGKSAPACKNQQQQQQLQPQVQPQLQPQPQLHPLQQAKPPAKTSAKTPTKQQQKKSEFEFQQPQPVKQRRQTASAEQNTERSGILPLTRRLSCTDTHLTPPAKVPKLTNRSPAQSGNDVTALAEQQLLQLQQQRKLQPAPSTPTSSTPPPLHHLHNRKPRKQPATVPQRAANAVPQQRSLTDDANAILEAQNQNQLQQEEQAQMQQLQQESLVGGLSSQPPPLVPAQLPVEEAKQQKTPCIMAVPTRPIPGYTETFMLCTLTGNTYQPMDYTALYLDRDLNQLVPVPPEAIDGHATLIVDHPSPEEIPQNSQQQQVVAGVQPTYLQQLISTGTPVSELVEEEEVGEVDETAVNANTELNAFNPEIVAENAIVLNIEGQQIILDAATFAHLLANPEANAQLITDDGTEFVLTREVLAELEAQQQEAQAAEAEQEQHQLQVSAAAAEAGNSDIIAVALAGSEMYSNEVLEIETSQLMASDGSIMFQPPALPQPHLTSPITAHTSETNALLNQTPIMSTLEKPSTAVGKRKPAELATNMSAADALLATDAQGLLVCRPNLDDSLAVIGVTTQSSAVPTSLELPITVTNPAIAPKAIMTAPPVDIVQLPAQCAVSASITNESRIYNDPGS